MYKHKLHESPDGQHGTIVVLHFREQYNLSTETKEKQLWLYYYTPYCSCSYI